ncbi:MAG TPA: c-type cytochrome [Vicinamibacterales bacterium]|nr:c-type cytochrome [Vicinamibacterales bacterium]
MRAHGRQSNAILVSALTSGLLLTALLVTGRATQPQAGSPTPPSPVVVDDAALSNEAGGDNWLAYGRTYSEQRFSPLTQISDATVSRLRPDWFVELPNDRGLVSTPLVVDGVLEAMANAGLAVYGRCGACHGPGGVSGGMAPDLRASAVVLEADAFARILRNGTRANRGMPAYEEITDAELTALRHYIRREANRALAQKP